jgi:hypothetical protein
MLSRTIKYGLSLLVALSWTGVSHAQWTDFATSIIDESSRSEVQNIFSDLKNVGFSSAIANSYSATANKLGLGANPTVALALLKSNQGLAPLTVSRFPIYKELKLTSLGNGYLYGLFSNLLADKQNALKKSELSDYLSGEAVAYIETIDSDGMLSHKLLSSFRQYKGLAPLINANPHYADFLKKEIGIVDVAGLPFLRYLISDITTNGSQLSSGAVPVPLEWNYVVNDGRLIVSGQKGVVASVKDGAVEIGQDISLLNCELPPSSYVTFNGGIEYATDAICRVTEVSFNVIKSKYKDKNKRQLNANEIVSAKDGKAGDKALWLVPKSYGGTSTWCNVVPMANDKVNKDMLKTINKKISELSKDGYAKVVAKLSYNSSSSNVTAVRFYSGSVFLGEIIN